MTFATPPSRLQVLNSHLQPLRSSDTPLASPARMSKAPITTHVLDTATGRPAAGVPVTLSYLPQTDSWTVLGTGTTNQDGRCSNLLTLAQLKLGTYKIRFDTAAYFATLNNHVPFYPYAEIVFNLRDANEHYHIPLLLSPYSYSTYKGS